MNRQGSTPQEVWERVRAGLDLGKYKCLEEEAPTRISGHIQDQEIYAPVTDRTISLALEKLNDPHKSFRGFDSRHALIASTRHLHTASNAEPWKSRNNPVRHYPF
jgi:hypothetical protein